MIPTYARTRWLSEAVFSAINQMYAGDIKVLVLNDCPQQEIYCRDPRVQCVNLPTKIKTLAEKRHLMLHMTNTDWVAFLDDDDLLMPNHLRAINHESAAVFPKTYFVTNDVGAWTMDPVPGGLFFMIERKAAISLGFTSGLDVGEDNAFRNEVKDRYRDGILWTPGPSYVWRRFLRGVGHISHMVKPDASPDVARFVAAADERILNKIEPSGRIMLEPRWEKDYYYEAIKRFPEAF